MLALQMVDGMAHQTVYTWAGMKVGLMDSTRDGLMVELLAVLKVGS